MTQTRRTFLTLAGFLLALIFAALIPVLEANALNSSSLTLSDPRPSQTNVNYTFSSAGFTTGTTIRCVDVFLNTQADNAGAAVGTTTSFTLDSSTVITAGSWTEDTSVNGRLRITNAAGQTPAASGNFVYGGITNAASEGVTYYAIFISYTDAACTTPAAGVDSVTVAFTLTNGELVQLTIDPTLTFTVASVASGQSVNGATTTVGSTATGIDFQNSVTFAANGVSAHDLQVGTNATSGYSVYVRHTGLLTNGSDTIANHTGTNATPTVFPAAGNEAWAYTTEDGSLAGGAADRFTNIGNVWAGFNTTNEVVVDNTSAPSGTETTRVGQQVGVSSGTPAGTYQTTIIYTVASVY